MAEERAEVHADDTAALRRRSLRRLNRWFDEEGVAPTLSQWRRRYGFAGVDELRSAFGSFDDAIAAVDPSHRTRRDLLRTLRATTTRRARTDQPQTPKPTPEESATKPARALRAEAVVEEVPTPKPPRAPKPPRVKAPKPAPKPREERYTRDDLIGWAQRFAAERGYGPSQTEFLGFLKDLESRGELNKPAPGSIRAVERIFGSIPKLREAAGVPEPRRGRHMLDSERLAVPTAERFSELVADGDPEATRAAEQLFAIMAGVRSPSTLKLQRDVAR